MVFKFKFYTNPPDQRGILDQKPPIKERLLFRNRLLKADDVLLCDIGVKQLLGYIVEEALGLLYHFFVIIVLPA